MVRKMEEGGGGGGGGGGGRWEEGAIAIFTMVIIIERYSVECRK